MTARSRIINVLVALDQMVFVLITAGSASPDETMSASAYRLEREGRWQGKLFRPLIDTLFFFDPMHCRVSFEAELHGYQRYRNSR